MLRLPQVVALVGLLTVGNVARAQIQTQGPEQWPGKNEVAVHLGYQAGVTGNVRGGPTPSGFKLLADYSFRFQEMLWLNFGVNFVFASTGACDAFGNCFGLDAGWTVEPHVGLKLKFQTPIPLVPYAAFQAVFVGIYNRGCGDNGFALDGRVAGGAKYFLTKNIGVGAEIGFMAGPAFYGSSVCGPSHVDFYASFDFAIGAEFIF
jgi:hypothetical protein